MSKIDTCEPFPNGGIEVRISKLPARSGRFMAWHRHTFLPSKDVERQQEFFNMQTAAIDADLVGQGFDPVENWGDVRTMAREKHTRAEAQVRVAVADADVAILKSRERN